MNQNIAKAREVMRQENKFWYSKIDQAVMSNDVAILKPIGENLEIRDNIGTLTSQLLDIGKEGRIKAAIVKQNLNLVQTNERLLDHIKEEEGRVKLLEGKISMLMRQIEDLQFRLQTQTEAMQQYREHGNKTTVLVLSSKVRT